MQAAGFIGTWNTDVSADRSMLDLGAASMRAGKPGLVGKPLPLHVALGRIHPDDRDRVFDTIRSLRRTGGRVALRFRILTGLGETRRSLDQGLLAPDEAGRLHGCGATIDLTDLHGQAPSSRACGPEAPDDLNAAAGHGIQARTALERHGDALHLLADRLLGIGRALAQRAS